MGWARSSASTEASASSSRPSSSSARPCPIGLLPTRIEELPELADVVARYRKLEAGVPVPRRAPGVLEADPFDQPLMERGNHKRLGKPVPRRFLEAVDDTPYQTTRSGQTPTGKAHTPAKAFVYPAFRNTLLTVIALFAAYLVFEFKTLWFRVFPEGFYYSGYAHQGAAWLARRSRERRSWR